MRGGDLKRRMRRRLRGLAGEHGWTARTVVAACGLVYAVGAACGGGGGDQATIAVADPFPQSFLPVVFASGSNSGDVSFGANGDLFAVRGTAEVTRVAKSDGSVSAFASGVGGGSTVLRSLVALSDGRVFAGDNAGRIFAIDAMGVSSLLIDTGSAPITGLAIAPAGFGGFADSLIAAADTSGVLVVTTDASPTSTPLAAPGERYVDVAFSGTTLFALDATDKEIDTVSAEGDVVSFQGGFSGPVGLGVDSTNAEILVADAGQDVLYALPTAGGTPTRRAPYDFATAAPSGVAFDGQGACAWWTVGPVLRGARVPRIDPADPDYGRVVLGTTVGYGDLEFDRVGDFLLSANDAGSTPPSNNFLIAISRGGDSASLIASGLGAAGEQLLGLAFEPVTGTAYVGSNFGNVFRRTLDGTIDPLASVSANPVLGLEIAPAGFGAFGGQLVATTSVGEVLAIDPQSPTPQASITATPILTVLGRPARLSDLVFASDGSAMYVLDNGNDTPNPPDPPRILRVTAAGGVTTLVVNTVQLGRPDGIEIDEGGKRLLIATQTAGGDEVIAVPLASPHTITLLAGVSIDDGFFPTGIVYDRLGRAVLRSTNIGAAIDAVSVFP